jgi:hypothetical protein
MILYTRVYIGLLLKFRTLDAYIQQAISNKPEA